MSVNNVQSNFSNGMSYSANLVTANIQPYTVPVVKISAATTLSVSDSGKVFSVSAPNVADYTITLPDPTGQSALKYSFVINSTLLKKVTIASGKAATMTGFALGPDDGTNKFGKSVDGGNKVNISFATGSLNGDKIDIVSDGTNFYASGFSALAGAGAGACSITFA